jgi:CRISPR/Cas system type I-B associated protein Csh2 (Cas7 group RAMP superfamily)
MTMTKRRKQDARSRQETTAEGNRPPAAATRSSAADEELERRMRSALADVYEVLGYASDERNAAEWSRLELVNDLVH